ncbi:NtaA/DmoA family FMN-dependent monooxygenase [Ottowia sp. GY511]|uniref:NtaA/DmoA family FMN-dependent monooxygenase n=1 Tax=Ottowia flava TaxID=2675430 RepID=A0ABW4KTL9_9BURK|nr:NtaA/DmoA family FMN-dependent monooxygenase [Ottowia sp. GY511]TXK31026.1 NtaA/DmoA family FMN-dependent monooxygenase [Ottowia sp. GY511]
MRNERLHIGFCLSATWLRGQAASPSDAGRDLPSWYGELACRAETACLDFVFKPDALFFHPAMCRGALALDGVDPTLLMAAIAAQTQRIGLVTTLSTTFVPPYVAARQLMSLHWLSQGRAGWNIVTALDGAANFGAQPMPDADKRYRKAAEMTALVRALWRSYPHEAIASGEGIRAVDHQGAFFQCQGPLNLPAYPLSEPVLMQAGASDTGRTFAASVAQATFAATPDMEAGIELCADLKHRARLQGRAPGDIRVLPGLHFFLGRTREEAHDRHRNAFAGIGVEQRLQSLYTAVGLDARALAPDARVDAALLPPAGTPVRSRTHAQLLRAFIARERPTLRELLERPELVGSAHWVAVGTAEDVADDVAAWFNARAMDGFVALPGGGAQSVDLFFAELVPELARRGLLRQRYSGRTLREHLMED